MLCGNFNTDACRNFPIKTIKNQRYWSKLAKANSGRSPGRAGGPAGCGHSKLASARTGFPLTSLQFVSVTEVVTEKRNKFLAKASEAEICTRVRCRYLTSFAGLHFKIEPGLTELYAAECRRNTPLCVPKRRQWRKRNSDVTGQAKIHFGRLFQHPPAAILNYHFAQTTLFFQITNTKNEELKIIILVKFFFFSVRNTK